jgi:Flp pilus assembly pilin Flp
MSTGKIGRFLRDQVGVAAVEFGLAIPILMIIFMGCFEAGRYLLLHQKLDRASTSVADLASLSGTISAAALADIYSAADHQTEPFDLLGQGRVILSSVYRDPSTPTVTNVLWQCQGGGALTGQTSKIGEAGKPATLPAYFPVDINENVVVAEVLYDYKPFLFQNMFQHVFAPKKLRHTSYTRPRGALLLTKPC